MRQYDRELKIEVRDEHAETTGAEALPLFIITDLVPLRCFLMSPGRTINVSPEEDGSFVAGSG